MVGGEIGDLVPLLLQGLAGLQHGGVLHGGGDDVLAGVAAVPCGGADGPVVALRSAGGEEKVFRFTAQGVGHNGTAVLHQSSGLMAQRILGGGIAELFGQHPVHSIRHGLGNRRGGGVIEIVQRKHPFGEEFSPAGGLATGGGIQYNDMYPLLYKMRGKSARRKHESCHLHLGLQGESI